MQEHRSAWNYKMKGVLLEMLSDRELVAHGNCQDRLQLILFVFLNLCFYVKVAVVWFESSGFFKVNHNFFDW